MKYVLDTHTHSTASGHAYSTLNEMVEYAQSINLELLGITEHAPAMPATCHLFYFSNLRVIPRKHNNLILSLGSEVNILDYDGNIDLPENILVEMDHVIASLHGCCISPGTISQNTNAILNAIKNPYVNIIGHPDDSTYPLDYDTICSAAADNNVLLEVNNSSLKPTSFRSGAKENYHLLLEKCKKYNTYIALGSDAHIKDHIADFTFAEEILKDTNFPDDLIINTSAAKFKSFISKKR